MGAVYRAIDTRFNRPCAVKEMLDDFQNETELNQAVEWFRREATLLLDLNHPCIPRVRDFFLEQDKHYLVMDFIEGRTLGEVLEKEGNVPGVNGAHGVSEARARSWGQQLCSVLGYLHRQNPPIIFRDLKPSNIMVTHQDEIKLIDFGIARTFQSQRQSTIIMTIGYAPPEQLHGMPEPRSDLYALGATLHRLLTHHDAANNKPSIFSFPLVRSLRPDISPAFDQVIMKALAPNLEQRWSGAAEMERAVINLPPVSARTPGPIVPPQSYQPVVNPQTPSSPQTNINASGIAGPGGSFIRAAQDHLSAGRLDAAYASIQQAHAVEPNNSLVHKIFGQIFARRLPPAPDLALQAYNHSLQLNPNDAETHKLVGDLYLFLRRQPAQAIQPYTQSLRLNPNNFEAHQRLAKCYEEMNQLDPALREYQEAARLAPKRPEIHYAVGQLAWRLNQLPVAERAFVQVLTINPADHQTRFLLSQVYERQGKFEDALRECTYVVSAMPGNSAAQAMLQRLRTQLRR
jgi:serine/threonine protein kinase